MEKKKKKKCQLARWAKITAPTVEFYVDAHGYISQYLKKINMKMHCLFLMDGYVHIKHLQLH